MLTNEQGEFVEFIQNIHPKETPVRALLVAPGGTGKTFTLRYILRMDRVVHRMKVLAPTHKACSLFQKEGIAATTVHQFLNAVEDIDPETGEIFFKFNSSDFSGILFVDECSMIGKDAFESLMSLNCHVIFIGDDHQIPPVREGISPVFNNIEKKFTFTVNKRLHLNRDSMSANYLKEFRQIVNKSGSKIRVIRQENQFVYDSFRTGGDIVLLSWTNKNVTAWNDRIRSNIFDKRIEELAEIYVGERLVFSGFRRFGENGKYYSSDVIKVIELSEHSEFVKYPICKHSTGTTETQKRKIQKCNQCNIKTHSVLGHKIEFYKIKDQNGAEWYYCKKESRQKLNEIILEHRAYCKKMKDKKIWREFIYGIEKHYAPDLKYSYAMTVHKAQGSEFQIVFVDIDNIRMNRDAVESPRLAYTAVSRFKQYVYFV